MIDFSHFRLLFSYFLSSKKSYQKWMHFTKLQKTMKIVGPLGFSITAENIT